MVRTLAEIAKNEGAWDNPWDAQGKKIASLQADIAQATDPIKRLILRRELAQQYVFSGASEPAIAALEQILVDYKGMLPPRDVETLEGDIAFAYFRLGELQNCTWNHNSDACIFPVAPDGIHKEQLGAREAAGATRNCFPIRRRIRKTPSYTGGCSTSATWCRASIPTAFRDSG